MSASTDQDRGLVRYLLGEASPAEREEIERRVLTEEGFDQEVLAEADDLIHAYLAGALSPEERSRFESEFLAPVGGRGGDPGGGGGRDDRRAVPPPPGPRRA